MSINLPTYTHGTTPINVSSDLRKLENTLSLYRSMSSLPRAQLSPLIKEIRTISECKDNDSLFTSPEKVMPLRTLLNNTRMQFLQELYPPSQEGTWTNADIHLIFSDMQSIFIPITKVPIKKSSEGLNGPVFLASYFEKDGIKQYAMKYTEPYELLASQIYRLAAKQQNCSVMIPRITGIDFNLAQFHIGTSSVSSPISEQECMQMQQCCSKIRELAKQIFKTNISLEKREAVMFEGFIPGENLLEFIPAKYTALSEQQKQELFKYMGQITFLDFIMGNLDRCIKIIPYNNKGEFAKANEDTTHFQFANELEANLGNIMLVSQRENIESGLLPYQIVGIDNTIDSSLTDQNSARAYTQFIKDILQNRKAFQQISECMIHCIEKTISFAKQESQSKEKTFGFSIFVDDLKTLAFYPFHEGLLQMAELLNIHWIPQWQNSTFRQDAQRLHPEFIARIDERFSASLTTFQPKEFYDISH